MNTTAENTTATAIPLVEMRADLADTESDIAALAEIVGALDIFMTRTGGEDRSAFRMDRFKYASLLSQAHTLKQRIQSAIQDACEEGASK